MIGVADTRVTEVDRDDIETMSTGIYDRLRNGEIFVLRGVSEIHHIRDQLFAALGDDGPGQDLAPLFALFSERTVPPAESMASFVRVLHQADKCRFVAASLADLIADLSCPTPILVEGANRRIVLPAAALDEFRHRVDLFVPTDFERAHPGATPEVFFADWSPPHRDIGRPHYTFMANLWFPLHDLDAENSLVMFPESYRRSVPIAPTSKGWREQFGTAEIAEWGYGKPLRVDLRFGDALLFHSETIHCSPVTTTNLPRLSFDVRFAAPCLDGNLTYRGTFSNYFNFLPALDGSGGGQGKASTERAAGLLHQARRTSDDSLETIVEDAATAQHLITWFEANLAQAPLSAIASVCDRLDRYPFAEDRYVHLAEGLRERGGAFTESLLRTVLETTDSFYWMARCGDVAMLAGLERLSRDAYGACADLCETTSVSFDHNPIDYLPADDPSCFGPRTQRLPEEFAKAARQRLGQASFGGTTILAELMPWAQEF